MKAFAYFIIALGIASAFEANAKSLRSCFDEWRIPNCSDKDPTVGRTCSSMMLGYNNCVSEVRAEEIRKKREREAKAREKRQKEEAEAARQRKEKIAKQRESKRAEIEAIEKANKAARELKKLNGPRPAWQKDDSERRSF